MSNIDWERPDIRMMFYELVLQKYDRLARKCKLDINMRDITLHRGMKFAFDAKERLDQMFSEFGIEKLFEIQQWTPSFWDEGGKLTIFVPYCYEEQCTPNIDSTHHVFSSYAIKYITENLEYKAHGHFDVKVMDRIIAHAKSNTDQYEWNAIITYRDPIHHTGSEVVALLAITSLVKFIVGSHSTDYCSDESGFSVRAPVGMGTVLSHPLFNLLLDYYSEHDLRVTNILLSTNLAVQFDGIMQDVENIKKSIGW